AARLRPAALSTIATTGGPAPSAATDDGVAFGSTMPSSSSRPASARSSPNHSVSGGLTRRRRTDAVSTSANTSSTTSRASSRPSPPPLGRDAVLEVGDHRVRAGRQRLAQLPFLVAGSEQERARSRELHGDASLAAAPVVRHIGGAGEGEGWGEARRDPA